ncbi:T9SS type A sorting domain-containing protein [uncultured Pontibacter sp.]|uniref:T9SS type A sorting domain-containing protein n=1 Tax=uncultured Pontibacter sp. TaxID=453356 RepID=UPI002639F081|nr:T9SS type A sorting domain-containing protein [uncultured Pontibacter sp.]
MTFVNADNFSVGVNGVLQVMAFDFYDNYSSFPAQEKGATIEYARSGDQNIVATIHDNLLISGSGIKSLTGNTTNYADYNGAGVVVKSGTTLDLKTYTLTRSQGTTSGGELIVESGAKLLIGNANTTSSTSNPSNFPAGSPGYRTVNLNSLSTVDYYGGNQTVSNQVYGNLHLTGSGIKILPNSLMNVAGNFEGNGTASFTARGPISISKNVLLDGTAVFNGASFTHTVGGDWTNNASFSSSTSTVQMNGSGKNIAGSAANNEFNNLIINGNTRILANNLNIEGNLSTTGANTLTQINGGTVTMAGAAKTITSATADAIKFQKLVVNGTINTGSTFTINEDINVTGSLNASAGTVSFTDAVDALNNTDSGDNDITSSGTLSFYGIRFMGKIGSASSFDIKSDVSGAGKFTATNGKVRFTGVSTFNGAHDFYDVEVAGAGKQLIMAGSADLGVGRNFTTTSGGAFNATANKPNKVTYKGTVAQTVLAATYHDIVFSNGGNNAKTAAGALTVNGDITISAGATLSAQTHNHQIYGSWINSGTFTNDNGTVSFRGNTDATITGSTTFYNLNINKATAASTVTLKNVITADNNLNINNGILVTGNSKVRALKDKVGDGWILGTITRKHAFNINTEYAFNAEYNTISFSAASGIDSVTVTTTTGTVQGFAGSAAINRTYHVTVHNGIYDGALKLQYTHADLNGNTEANLQPWYSATGTGNWTAWTRDGEDANQNWVRKASLTSMNGYYTLYANSGIVRWKGTTDTQWNLASNWVEAPNGVENTVQRVPSLEDVVELGAAPYINQPTIATAVDIKGLQFKGTTQTTLTLAPGGSLSVQGNLTAIGAAASTPVLHEIRTNAQTLTVGGNMILNDGGEGNNISLVNTTGVITVTGSLDHKGAGVITLGTGTFKLSGDFLNAAYTRFSNALNTSPRSHGEFIYEGGNSQVIGEVLYHNLTINKSAGVATLTAAQTGGITGNLKIQGGTLSIPGGTYTVGGNILQTGGTFSIGASTLNIANDWTKTGGDFEAGTSTVGFIGSAAQTIPAVTFHNLTIARPDITTPITLAGDVLVNATLDVQSGLVNLGLDRLDRSAVGGTFSLRGTSVLQLDGSNFPANFNNDNLDITSKVVYKGTGLQNIESVIYGNLELLNGGTVAKKLIAATQVKGDLTINEGATLDANSEALTLSGHFANNGSFIPGSYNADGKTAPTGTVILASTSGIEKTLSGKHIYVNDLLVEKGAHYKFLTDLTIQGGIDIVGAGNVFTDTTKTTFDLVNNSYLNAASAVVSIAGNFKNQGILRSSGSATFLGTREQNIQLLAPILPGDTGAPTVVFTGEVPPVLNSNTPPQFANVTISNIGGVTTSVNWTVLGSFVVMPGAKFHGGSFTHNFATAFTNLGTVTSSGILNFEPLHLDQKSDGILMTSFPFNMGTDSTSLLSTGTVRFGGDRLILLAGAIPSKFNNLIVANTHPYGIQTMLYGISLTQLSEKVPAITGTTWRFDGDFRIEQGALFVAGPGTRYIVGGDMTNNGVFNSPNADLVLLSTRVDKVTNEIIPSTVSGVGGFSVRNLTVEGGAKANLESNITLTGNFNHLGAELKASNIEINFTGTAPATVNATSGIIGLGNLRVSKTGTGDLTLNTNVEGLRGVHVESGTLDATNKDLIMYGATSGPATATPTDEAGNAEADPGIGEDNAIMGVADNATLRIGGAKSLPTFNLYALEPASTVTYYGSNQIIKDVQYGNLDLAGTNSTKTFTAGATKIAGNFTKASDLANVVSPGSIEYNGANAQEVAAINYTNLAFSNTGAKTFATGKAGISGTATKESTAVVNAANTNVTVDYNGASSQIVLPINYYNLDLSNGGVKSFTGTTGIAKDFTITGASADLVTAASTINFNGSTAQKVAGAAYYDVLVSGGGSKEFAANAQVANRMEFVNGKIDTKANKVILANTASFVNESNTNYLTGTVETTRNVTGAESFGGLGMTVTPTEGTPGSVKITRVTGPNAALGNGANVKRYFLLEPSTANSSNRVDVAISYFDHELEPEMVGKDGELVFYWSSNNSSSAYWKSILPSATPAGKQVQGTNLGPTGYFTLGRTITPLPVELISFTAARSGSNAVINWATAMEQDNDGFGVEVSTDGHTYRKIGFVKSKAVNTYSKQAYTFTDTEGGKQGTRYYRLRQLDTNGEAQVYGPRAVDFNLAGSPAVAAFPNPFQSSLQLSINTTGTGNAQAILYDAAGRVVYKEIMAVEAGLSEKLLNTNFQSLKTGLYLLVFEMNGEKQSIKVIKN